jgi:nucleoside 2-deoxyribosyltransferase
MKIIMAQEEIELDGLSIFLAGPTPRDNYVTGWREMAIEGFKQEGFNGTLLIPELRKKGSDENDALFEYDRSSNYFDYSGQIEWELEAMEKADIILFHINRRVQGMPGFTTNIEFGYWIAKDKSKIVLSIPDKSEKMEYIKYLANKEGIKIHKHFMDALKHIKDVYDL